MLVFCHGRIESAPAVTPPSRVIDVLAPERPVPGVRTKLPRTGTLDVHYLDEMVDGVGDREAVWGAPPQLMGSAAAGSMALAPRVRGRWGWGLGVGGVIVAAAAILWMVSRPAPPPPAPQPAAPGAGGSGPRVTAAGWGEGALAAWQAFSRAGTPAEKLAHVLDAERVGPLLTAYYAARPGSDDSWAGREFKPLAGTADDRRRGLQAMGYSPTSTDDRPVILFFRSVPAARSEPPVGAVVPRFLLDWETYIQERERLVERFLSAPADGQRTFRLAVERVHVFDEDTTRPRQGESLGLKLRTPSGLLLARTAEIRAGSPLYARFDEQLRWGMPAYATLQLAWDTPAGSPPRVKVADFVCWHFPGLGGTPEFEADLSPLPSAPAGTRR